MRANLAKKIFIRYWSNARTKKIYLWWSSPAIVAWLERSGAGKGVVRYRHENFAPGDEVALEEAVRSAIDAGK